MRVDLVSEHASPLAVLGAIALLWGACLVTIGFTLAIVAVVVGGLLLVAIVGLQGRAIVAAVKPCAHQVGGQLEGRNDQGEPQIFYVKKIKGSQVLLDGNHPLAGMELRFVLKVLDVRAAAPEELAHRHVHGAGGHHH